MEEGVSADLHISFKGTLGGDQFAQGVGGVAIADFQVIEVLAEGAQ